VKYFYVHFIHKEIINYNLTYFKYLFSKATLIVGINRVLYFIGSFRFFRKAVVLLPTADWRYIRELNRMATLQEKSAVLLLPWCYRICDDNAVTMSKKFGSDTPSNNSVIECFRKLTEEGCLYEGWAGPDTKQCRECGTSKRSFFTRPTKVSSPSHSTATDATYNCMAGFEETFAYGAIQSAVTSGFN
jgi:hypothetical protein